MMFYSEHNFRLPAFIPLSFTTLTKYFLVPYIAVCLIADDRNTDFEGAWEVMTKSADHGEALHALQDGDEILEEIFQRNATMGSHRRKLEQWRQEKDDDYVWTHLGVA
jgi:hypothetical protein